MPNHNRFENIVLLSRGHRKGMEPTLTALEQHLTTREHTVFLEEKTADLIPNSPAQKIARDQIGEQCQLMIVVGGDGSLLHAAHLAIEQNIPVVGINRGRLGFLTDFPPNDFSKIDDVLDGKYIEESRFTLSTSINLKNHHTPLNDALNEVVINAGNVTHMIEFDVYIDEQFVCHLRADGIIIATPTGSTAYALSGGGPILHPSLDAIALIPMFPHTLSNRPVVIKANSQIHIDISGANQSSPYACADGQPAVQISPGTQLTISRKNQELRLLHPIDYNYFQTLRSKLHWQTKP